MTSATVDDEMMALCDELAQKIVALWGREPNTDLRTLLQKLDEPELIAAFEAMVRDGRLGDLREAQPDHVRDAVREYVNNAQRPPPAGARGAMAVLLDEKRRGH